MKREIGIALILLLQTCLVTTSARAEPVAVRILVGSRPVAVVPTPVFDGKRVLAPPGILASLGASYVTSTDGKRVTVTNSAGTSGEIETVAAGENQMLPMDRVAALLGADAAWDEGKRTLKLVAHLESAEFVDETLKVNCSLPVVYSVRVWAGKLIVDAAETRLASEAKEVFIGSPTATRARLGQYNDTTARVVLDMTKPTAYSVESRAPASQIVVKIGAAAAPQPPAVAQPKPQPKPPGGQPFTIENVSIETADDTQFDLVIATSSKGAASLAYGVLPPKITVTLPHAAFCESFTDCEGSHPLIQHVEIGRGPNPRVELELTRIAAYDLRVSPDAIRLTVRMPDGSGGTLAGKTVVIDPGHGGREKGARSNGINEKDINLKIANELAAALAQEGAQVVLTRSGDQVMGLAARSDLAINGGADFFISVHCNSNHSVGSASGIETYYHMQESSPRALAYAVHAGVCKYTGMCDRRPRSDSSLYSSGLAVLRRLAGTELPGVLLECGYMNHAADLAKLVDASHRKKLAAGIVAGLKAYVEGTPIN